MKVAIRSSEQLCLESNVQKATLDILSYIASIQHIEPEKTSMVVRESMQ